MPFSPPPRSSLLLLLALIGTSASADNLFDNISHSVTHSAKASVHSLAAGGQAVSAVVAVPFKATGAVGKISDEIGDSLWDAAKGKQKLPISDKTPSLQAPPDVMLSQLDP